MIPYPCSFLINNSYISKTSREAVHIEMVSIKRTDKVDKKILITRFILFSGSKANGTFPSRGGWHRVGRRILWEVEDEFVRLHATDGAWKAKR